MQQSSSQDVFNQPRGRCPRGRRDSLQFAPISLTATPNSSIARPVAHEQHWAIRGQVNWPSKDKNKGDVMCRPICTVALTCIRWLCFRTPCAPFPPR
ncbi:hypothetical protein AAFF_G00351820 [Aldrovandia affinis]|uniref:Uncharacterized protein n=1 Tax=Aldrovandia affinis TaxID=143900 RepID=A0AAD7WNQ0_9TELE|nr:hypothetical protein AAFF_G00351820 [Aldrovandia affinis]